MRRKLSSNNHTIDFLFPLALFFAFALCALAVLLFATSVYQNAVNTSSRNDSVQTALSYAAEKIHQNDAADTVFRYDENALTAAGLAGVDEALVFKTTANDAEYLTYIYEYDGKLMELSAKAGSAISPSAGTAILALSDFQIEILSDNLFRITCTDTDGNSDSAFAVLNSCP